ncbi:MAG: 3-dehydroquinate synthase [Leeuwenhoekiella sp.]
MQPIQAKNYQVVFNKTGYTALNDIVKSGNYSTIFVLVDSHTHESCIPVFLSQLQTEITIEIIEIEAGEEYKNLETCSGVWSALSELGADRKSLMINLGGGVVTDLGGFVASTFKRGIDFINVPTTLLAMVDASVGGKTGVDLGNLKNQIGVINNPKVVLVATEFLQTLPQVELRSGYAEMLKHGLITSDLYWQQVNTVPFDDLEKLDNLIYDSVLIKNEVVLEDPFENGLRKTLNYGHTLGHAIESYFLTHPQKTKLLHGEAIAIGMILETYLSTQLTGFDAIKLDEITAVFKAQYPQVTFDKDDIPAIIDLLRYDKKNSHGRVNFVLLKDIGTPVIDVQVEEKLILAAFEFYQKN